MGPKLLIDGPNHPQTRPIRREAAYAAAIRGPSGLPTGGQGQAYLSARHRQIDVGKDLRVEQGAVKVTLGVIHPVPFAQGIEGVALAGMQGPSHHQRVRDGAEVGDPGSRMRAPGQLGVEEPHIEGGIVDDKLRTFHIANEVVGDVREAGFVLQELVGDPVHLRGPLIDLPIRLEILMEVVAGEPAIHQLDATDLDDPVSFRGLEAGRLSVKHDLSHADPLFVSRPIAKAERPDRAGIYLTGPPCQKVRLMPDAFSTRAAELVEAGRLLFQRGMVPATSGNLSARLADGSLAITVSGRHKGRLSEADIMRVDADGHALDGRRPSAETLLHCQIYRRLAAAGAVLHPHSVSATVVSRLASEAVVLAGYELLKAFPGIETHVCSLTVPIFPNDQDIPRLAAAVEAWMDRHGSVAGYLIAGHGFYTWGRDVAEALRHVEALDFLFECELRLRELRQP